MICFGALSFTVCNKYCLVVFKQVPKLYIKIKLKKNYNFFIFSDQDHLVIREAHIGGAVCVWNCYFDIVYEVFYTGPVPAGDFKTDEIWVE